MSKATLRKNGKHMFTIQVKHHLSAYDMAVFFTADRCYDVGGEESIKSLAWSMTKSDIWDRIKFELKCNGDDRASYVVGDNNLNECADEVEKIFHSRFF